MKKVLALAIAAIMILSVIPFAAAAAESKSIEEYEGKYYVIWDNVFKNNEDAENLLSPLGGAGGWISEQDGVIKDPEGAYTAICLSGWVAFDQEIKAYGYRIDDGEIVFVDEAYREADPAVVDAAATVGCDYAARYCVTIPTAGLLGLHKLGVFVKVADGEVYMLSRQGQDIEVGYQGPEDPNATDTPVPEETPAADPSENAPGVWLTFDEEEKYPDLFNNGHGMSADEYDEEKKCQLILVDAGGDPYIALNIGGAILDYFEDGVDCDEYKVLQLGVKVNPKAGNSGQIYYTNEDEGNFNEGMAIAFNYKQTEEFQALTINFTRTKKWSGLLGQIRYDAFGETTDESDIELYYVAFFKTKDQADAFAKEFAEKGYDAFPVIATPTPKPTNTPSPTPTSTPEETDEPEATTAPTVTEAPKDNDKPKKGCGSSVVCGGVLVCLLGAAVAVIGKKKNF
ncbi:MAG: hypothetical protein J6X47_07220 [Clostridia bacterium]|nr:hypothetical protein [Clostridia bacterium]MBP5664888.1 hypothetical protein [Clostridia bacterium]MBP5766760.1 hypothetical protein [Clostridia bacterium]